MDVTHRDPAAPDASAIETAARDMGIIPGDPAYGFVQFMVRSAEAEARARQAHLAALAPMLAEVRTLKAEVQRAADKPLMTDHQLKWNVLPALLAAWSGWQVVVGTLLLMLAGLFGMGCTGG